MKSNLIRPSLKIILLFIGFVLTTFILGGFLLNGLLRIPSQLANCVVIGAIVYISYRAYKKEGKNLTELGLNLNFRNLRFGIFGLIIGGLFIIPLVYLIAFVKSYPVIFNTTFDPEYVLNGLWILAPTVILEELVFRGICFKNTIRITGVVKANMIFATLFILSHWINLGAFGNPANMTVLLITGIGHLLYATALLKSKTLYFPIGIHLGNNWVNLFVFNGLDVNDRTAGQIKHSLINVIAQNRAMVFDGQLLLTTALTALLFLLFTFAIQKWFKSSSQLNHCTP